MSDDDKVTLFPRSAPKLVPSGDEPQNVVPPKSPILKTASRVGELLCLEFDVAGEAVTQMLRVDRILFAQGVQATIGDPKQGVVTFPASSLWMEQAVPGMTVQFGVSITPLRLMEIISRLGFAPPKVEIRFAD